MKGRLRDADADRRVGPVAVAVPLSGDDLASARRCLRLGRQWDPLTDLCVGACESTDGEVDVLSQRIAQIRTWTFVSNRAEWLANPPHWQERTRASEDARADARHDIGPQDRQAPGQCDEMVIARVLAQPQPVRQRREDHHGVIFHLTNACKAGGAWAGDICDAEA